MAYSRYTLIGDGVTTQVAINFPLGFLDRSNVTIRVGSEVDGLMQPVYRTLTWINDGLVNIEGGAPGVGVPYVVQRTVPKTALVHDYSNGAPIIEQNLDDSNKQNIMIAHEALDGRFGALQQDLDLNGFKGINAANPANPQDLATKAYVDSITVLPNGNVPPPTLGNVGMFLKATGTGIWAWATITLADVLGAAVATYAQLRAATSDAVLVSPVKLGSLWRKSAVNVVSATNIARPADADLGRIYNLTASNTVSGLWSGTAGEVAYFQIVNGVAFIHSAALKLKAAGGNITTVAGDTIEFTCMGGTNWEQTGGMKQDGTSWVAPVIDNDIANKFEYLYTGSL